MPRKSGKTYRKKSHDRDFGDEEIGNVSKKQILSERKRRFERDLKRAIDNGDYDELEDWYDY